MGSERRRLRRGIAIGLVLTLTPIGWLMSQSAGAAGTPLLAIGIDVSSATATRATYSITLRNEGSGDSTSSRVSLSVPAGTTFESSTPPASPVDGGAVPTCDDQGTREAVGTSCQWSLGTVAPGQISHISVVLNLSLSEALGASSPPTVSATASVAGINPATGSAAPATGSDTDGSLVRYTEAIASDTHVARSDPVNTSHGACPSLSTRGDGMTSAYVDVANLNGITALERIWSAELVGNVTVSDYGPGSPGTLALFPITSGDWTEGAGGCSIGIPGSGTDVRTGSEPSVSTTPSATRSVDQNGPVRWNVTTDLDGASERAAFQGWQIRNTTGWGTLDLASSESPDSATQPRVVIVYTRTEAPGCIDVDPEFTVKHPKDEQIVTAIVTDGGAGRVPQGEDDACPGTPLGGRAVNWNIDDDDPQIYISNQDGALVPKTDTGGPNFITTTTDSNGLTSIGVRLTNPDVWTGEGRVAGCFGTDAACNVSNEPPADKTQCSLNNSCQTGESNTEDDVNIQWSPTAPSPSPSPTRSTSATSSPKPSVSSSPSTAPGSGTGSGSPTPGSTARGLSPVDLQLTTASDKTTAGLTTELAGSLSSDNPLCSQAGTSIEILKREAGAAAFEHLGYASTGVGGTFTFDVGPAENTVYEATVPMHDVCDAATSLPITVLVKPLVTIKSTAKEVEGGKRFWVTGRVTPEHQLTPVTLWRKIAPGQFRKLDRDVLDDTSRYSFTVRYIWSRAKTVFIVRWKATDDDHLSSKSQPLVIQKAS